MQAAGERARGLRAAWLHQHKGKVRFVGADLTPGRRGGAAGTVAIAVEAQHGLILAITLLENEQAETLRPWLQPL